MKNPFYLRINKIKKENIDVDFYRNYNTLLNESICTFKKSDLNFRELNESEIEVAKDKYNKVFHKKLSSIAVENFTVTCMIIDNNFYENYNYKKFGEHLYKCLNKYLNILSFLTYKQEDNSIVYIAYCNAIVKNVFMEHIQNRLIEKHYNIQDIVGCLSYNSLLGGSKADNSLGIFYKLIYDELKDKYNYNICTGSSKYLEQLYISKYNNVSLEYLVFKQETNALLAKLEEDDLDTYYKILTAANKENLSDFLHTIKS